MNLNTILVVDDDPFSRFHAQQFLQHEKHTVFCAENGQEGVDMFLRHRPVLVLMDLMMPVMNGYEATRAIRAEVVGKKVPIIFLTGERDKEKLAECLNCGGDDFLTKPFDNIIMKARINSWLRKVALAERIAHDRDSVERVILKMREDADFDPRGLRILMTPLEKTNGDIVLSAFRDDQIQHLLVGDFTGHGLSAAVCGPLVSDIFYSMTKRGFSAPDILMEINRKIHMKLPVDMFLAACFLEIQHMNGQLRVWNCAMPDVMIFRCGALYQKIRSAYLPLGIKKEIIPHQMGAFVQIESEDLIYAFSDGIVETQSVTNAFFGIENLENSLTKIIATGSSLDTLHGILEKFSGNNSGQKDDISIIELKCICLHETII